MTKMTSKFSVLRQEVYQGSAHSANGEGEYKEFTVSFDYRKNAYNATILITPSGIMTMTDMIKVGAKHSATIIVMDKVRGEVRQALKNRIDRGAVPEAVEVVRHFEEKKDQKVKLKEVDTVRVAENYLDTNGSVVMLTAPSNSSVRQARAWFKDHGMEVIERSISNNPLLPSEVIQLFSMSCDGIEDLIGNRSKAYKKYQDIIESGNLKLSEMARLICENPTLLKFPVIIQDGRFMTGFNDEEARSFLPRSYKLNELRGLYRSDRKINGIKTFEVVEEIESTL